MMKKDTDEGKTSLGKVIIPIMIITAVIAAIITIIATNKWYVDIEINDNADTLLEYGQKYEKESGKGFLKGKHFCRKGIPIKVKTTGSVNDKKIGKYKIKYTVKFLGLETQKERNVEVKDQTPPEIELTTNPESYTAYGEAYVEEGYKAIDACDGDVTDKVIREENDGIVYYTVTDSSGNTATVTRTINYKDVTPPEIILQGDSTVLVKYGKEYIEPGYTSIDDVDGDISSGVVVTGEVNTNESGAFTITYTSTDNSGNISSQTRTVIVDKENNTNISPDDRVIYLTFDDGPGPYTEKLLSILNCYGVKVTFFVTNSKYAYLMEREAAEGHTVAMHTSSHRYNEIYSSPEAYFNDLTEIQNVIEQYTGKKSNLLRFPGGSSNAVSRSFCKGIMTQIIPEVGKRGLIYVDWNVSSGDADDATTAYQVAQNIIDGIRGKKIAVVLQHDIKEYSVDAVAQIIEWGLANGYRFLPLDENSPQMHHGKIYN